MPTTPIEVGFTTPEAANMAFTCTVTMTGTVTADTTIQLYCTDTSLVHNSSGGAFPTSAIVLNGHSSVQVSLKTGAPSTDAVVTLAAGQPGTDMSQHSNWQASKSMTIQGTGSP